MAQSVPIALGTNLSAIPAIGTRRANALATLGLTNVGKLIAHLPMRHERLEAEAPIGEVAPGQIIAARGQITATRVVMRPPRPRFEAVVLDASGRLDVVWFNMPHLRHQLHPGMRVWLQGKTNRRGSMLQLVNPNWRVIGDEAAEPEAQEERLRPVYPASEAAPSRMIEQAMKAALPLALPLLEDHLPEAFLKKKEMPSLREAYRMMHAPESEAEIAAGRRRLAYDELLLLQLAVHLKRAHLREVLRAPAMRWSPAIDRRIRERFGFDLTESQAAVVQELVKDLTSETPTNRLIQGDVGSGKTVVALYAMLLAVASDQQAALMAPTEILAEQHFSSISGMLRGSKVRVELLTGGTPQSERESILGRCALGEVDILIGTHALLTENVQFRALGVAIVDEQHRFGVEQRAMLRSKGERDGETERRRDKENRKLLRGAAEDSREYTSHVLVMTATPIPRTLGIALFGDLDISTIAQLPPGRQKVQTRVVGPEKRGEVYTWLRERLDKGDQAFIVVPAIDRAATDETGEAADVRSVMQRLEDGELAGKRIAALHGRLARATREHIMERFRLGLIDCLVATTVIEVGVDVPNATIMIIEQAERFGLAQLHQLRGRVGRGSKKSYCVLIGDAVTEDARQRLEAIAATGDGFVLAEKDFELRGPGEIFGTRQSGLPPLKVADLMRDLDLLKMAKRDAAAWIARSPGLDQPGEELLNRRLRRAYGQWLGLGDVG
jgi:ATP-dependent DNA helicase RecG